MILFRLMLVTFSLLLLAQSAKAHQVRPAIVDLEFTQNAFVKVHIQTNIESLIAGIDSSHNDTNDSPQTQLYNQLRALSSQQLSNEFKLFEESIISELNLAFDGVKSDL